MNPRTRHLRCRGARRGGQAQRARKPDPEPNKTRDALTAGVLGEINN